MNAAGPAPLADHPIKNQRKHTGHCLMLCGRFVQVHVGRGYGRVCRRRLRDKLMQRCKQQGVQFLHGEMTGHSVLPEHGTAQLTLKDGSRLQSR